MLTDSSQRKKIKIDTSNPVYKPFFDKANAVNLYEGIPKWKLAPLRFNRGPTIWSGPYKSQYPLVELHRVFGTTISTYPHYSHSLYREGEPNCDSYRIHAYENFSVVCIADGCNWGERPREASNRSKDAFVEYVCGTIGSAKYLSDAGHILVAAMAVAHESISFDKDDVWMAGTTTLLGGIVLPIQDKNVPDLHWTFIAVTVGDCKALHLNTKTNILIDLTEGNRLNLSDARDPGGRIGPHIKSGEPDLRNLRIFFKQCEEDDLIVLLSDGIHDNLDPQTLGKTPQEIGLNEANWEDVSLEVGIKAKTKFMNDLILSVIYKDNKLLTPKQIVKKLIQYCMDITDVSRQHMEQNPQLVLESDYKRFPGKMDHTTCISFKIGVFDQEKEIEYEQTLELKETMDPKIWPY